MTWKELIENVDKSKDNVCDIDLMSMGEDFGKFDVPWVNTEDSKIQAYWYIKWYCTDTWVGGRLYFLDGIFVGHSYQSGRKCGEEYEWLDKESYKKVSGYLEELRFPDNESGVLDKFMDNLDEDIGDSFTISYGCQAIIKKGFITETKEKFEVKETYRDYSDIKKWSILEVEMENGEKKSLNVKDVRFPYIVKNK